VFRVSGIAVNHAREAYVGGERKSDAGDARIIADQLRLRWKQLPEMRLPDEHLAELAAGLRLSPARLDSR
jgi:Transposase